MEPLLERISSKISSYFSKPRGILEKPTSTIAEQRAASLKAKGAQRSQRLGQVISSFFPGVIAASQSVKQRSAEPYRKFIGDAVRGNFVMRGDTPEQIREKTTNLALGFLGHGASGPKRNLAKEYAEQEAKKLAEQVAQKGSAAPLLAKTNQIVARTPTSKVSNIEPLTTEARKYKSAEEFVKGLSKKEFRYDDTVSGIIEPNYNSKFGTLPFEEVNKLQWNQGSVDPKGVKKWLKKIQAGERPYVMVDVTRHYMDGNVPPVPRIIDGHTRFEAYRDAGIKDIPIIDRSGKILKDGQGLTDFYNQATKSEAGDVVTSIAQSKDPADIAKLLNNTGVDKTQVPQMSKVLAGVDNPNKVTKIIEGFDVTRTPRKPLELPDVLEEKRASLDLKKEILANDPARDLSKFAARRGDYKGLLPEVTGTGKSNFGRKGDNIVTELGFKDSEEARAAYEQYVTKKNSLKLREQDLKKEIKSYTTQEKARAKGLLEKPASSQKKNAPLQVSEGEARTLEKTAQQQVEKSNLVDNSESFSLSKIVQQHQTPVKAKVSMLDYIRTPEHVLKKIGLEREAGIMRDAYEGYLKELPENIEKITTWSKQVGKPSNERIFKYLDGEAIDLAPNEKRVASEIKSWLGEWADRLGLPKDDRIGNYITHLFDDQLIAKEFDEDLAKIIADKIPGSVYDPFLQKRLGAKGYKQDTWAALDAYAKRATRKVHMDPALSSLEEASQGLEKSQWDYVKNYADRVNMRPTDIDNLIDNGIKQMVGYRFGQRPTLAVTRLLRQMTYRGMLGLNISSALRNLSQGANTYAKLGEKYTAIGYTKLLSPKNHEELLREGVLNAGFIEDRAMSATMKAVEKVDKVLWFMFDQAERINRGAAYFGAKSKALAQGKTEQEAIKFAKKIVRDTQFVFGSIDTPLAMQSDIMKTLTQFQSFTTKQIEFLANMAKNKEFLGLARYATAGLAFVYTIGQAFGMEPKDLIPIYRLGTPPSLKLPVETGKALLGSPDKYGNQRDLKKKLSDIGKSAIGLIPGGIQGKKTYEGYRAVQEGASTDKAGRTQFEVGGSLAKDAQAILFGKYAAQEAKDYFDGVKTPEQEAVVKERERKAELKSKVTPVYERAQAFIKQGRMAEAQALVDQLSDSDYEIYKDIRSADRAKRTEQLRALLRQDPVQAVSYLRKQDSEEQKRLLKVMTEEEYQLYQIGKEAN